MPSRKEIHGVNDYMDGYRLLNGEYVIANDSVQTLGTWIASNNEKFNYKILWGASSAVLLWALWYGWYTYGGDISYGRLNKIPFAEVQWYHALAIRYYYY